MKSSSPEAIPRASAISLTSHRATRSLPTTIFDGVNGSTGGNASSSASSSASTRLLWTALSMAQGAPGTATHSAPA